MRLQRAPIPRRAQAVRGFSGTVIGRGGSDDNEEGRPMTFGQDGLGRALQAWSNVLMCLDMTAALGKERGRKQ
jgi:hypothetical protein